MKFRAEHLTVKSSLPTFKNYPSIAREIRTRGILICIFGIASALGFPHAAAGENLIQNGSFEKSRNALPLSWATDIWGTDTDGVKFFLEDGDAPSGNRYITIQNIRPNDSKLVQRVKVKPNSLYRLACWIKTEGVGKGTKGANITVLDIVVTSQDLKDTKGAWKHVELYGRTGPDQKQLAVSIRLGFYGNINTGKASFDDVSLEQIRSAPKGVEVINFYPLRADGVGPTLTTAPLRSSLMAYLGICGLFLVMFLVAYRLVVQKKISERVQPPTLITAFHLLLFVSLLVRIGLALLSPGYPQDMATFKAWAMQAAGTGLRGLYQSDMFIDYPPGYMYVLYIIGKLRNLFSLGFDSRVFLLLIKLPGIMADLITSYLVFVLAKRSFHLSAAAVIGLLYAFNPITAYNSAVYGQMDSFFTLFILITVVCISRERLIQAAVFFTFSILLKPQAFIFAPIALCVLITRKNVKTVLFCLLAAASTVFVTVLPFSFGQHPLWIFRLYTATLKSYPYATLNAFNLYALLGGNWAPVENTLLFLPYRSWGWIFSGVIAVASAVFCLRGRGVARISYAAFFVLFAVYMLVHKMHERYLFPAIALALLTFIYSKDRRFLFLFVGLSITLFLNVAYTLDTVLTKQLYWLPKNDMLLRVISLVNLLMLILTVKIGIDVFFRQEIHSPAAPKRKMGMKLDSIRQEYETSPQREAMKLVKIDYVLMVALSLVYASIAFLNLGSLKAPQTYWQAAISGESFSVDLGRIRQLDRVCYYLGLGKGSFKIAFSKDGELWHEWGKIAQKSLYEEVEWRYFSLSRQARYLRVSAETPGVMLNEIVLFGPNREMYTVQRVVSEATTSTHGKPENVFDEQQTVQYTPSFYNGMYFDEIYHARTAYEHLHRFVATETTHPPLGKVIISVGIALFGMTPFGWRFMGTLCGVLMIPCMYLFAKSLLRKTEYAFFASFLLTFDFMHFVQTRIATIDVYGVFFILLMYLFMYRFFSLHPAQLNVRVSIPSLLICGVCFGLGVACKWIGLYAGLGLAVILFSCLKNRYYEYREAKRMLSEPEGTLNAATLDTCRWLVNLFPRSARIILLWSMIAFIGIPLIIYSLSYIPVARAAESQGIVATVLDSQKHMYKYHSELEATHPFSSDWWEWPLIKRPIWYYGGQEDLPAEKISSIAAMGNPAVWWIGVLAVIAVAAIRKLRRERGIFFILVGLASQYLPWIVVPRKLVFIYHFFASVPFIILGTIFMFAYCKERWRWTGTVMYIYLGVVLVLFGMFYPILSGAVVSKAYAVTWLRWFPTWVFFR